MSQSSRLDKLAAYAPMLIAVYFVAQVVLRIWISPSLGKDEAEQVLLAQELAWGYGSQPPLYTWLVAAMFAVFGDGILGLALVKNLLLAGTYLLTFATVYLMTGNRLPALLAAASLLLLPQIAWESQRALTHSVLVIFAAALFAFAFVRVLQRRKLFDYALLGVAFAVGMMAKFNFPIFAISMIAAALSMADFRGHILHRGFLLAVAVSALLLWRPGQWLLEHQGATMSRAHKLTGGQTDNLMVNYATGISELALGTVSILALLLIVFAVAVFRSPQRESATGLQRRYWVLLARSIAIALGLCLVMILIFEVTKVKSRWLQPILYAVPIMLVLQAWPRLTPRRLVGILSVAGLCAVLILVMLPLRTFEGPSIGRLNPLHSPYRRLAVEIRAFGFKQGSVLASFNLLGGNMRLQFPQSAVVTPEYPRIRPLPPGPILLVWESTRDRRLPRKLSRLFERLTGRKLPATELRYVSARLLYAPDHRLGLGVIVIKDWRQLPAIK